MPENTMLFDGPPDDATIEIGSSFEEMAMMEGLKVDPDFHQLLPDSDYLLTLRRVCGLPQLFIYRHRRTGNFVLAAWTIPGRVCTELKAWSSPLVNYGGPHPEWVQWNTRPTQERIRDRLARMREANYEKRAGEAESYAMGASVTEHYRRKGDMASMFESMRTRYVSRREDPTGIAETEEMLKEAASDAGRISG